MNLTTKFTRKMSLVLAAAMLSGAASAQEFEGAYGGIEAGVGILKLDGTTLLGPVSESDSSGLVGGVFGYRAPLADGSRLVFGVEGNVDLYTSGSDARYGVYGTAGYRVNDAGLAYLRLGYSWLDGVNTGNGSGIDGITYGGGYEFAFRERMNFRVDYRYIDYGGVNFPDNSFDFKGHEITAAVIYEF